MVDYARILFPLDLSPAAPLVAGHAASLALKYQAELHVLHVVPRYEGPDFMSHEMAMSEIKENMNRELEAFREKYLAQVKEVRLKVLSGHTGRTVLEYAKRHGVDLVIMGTHGRSGMGKLFFGSVAQRVVQNSTVPVLTVHPALPEKRSQAV